MCPTQTLSEIWELHPWSWTKQNSAQYRHALSRSCKILTYLSISISKEFSNHAILRLISSIPSLRTICLGCSRAGDECESLQLPLPFHANFTNICRIEHTSQPLDPRPLLPCAILFTPFTGHISSNDDVTHNNAICQLLVLSNILKQVHYKVEDLPHSFLQCLRTMGEFICLASSMHHFDYALKYAQNTRY